MAELTATNCRSLRIDPEHLLIENQESDFYFAAAKS